MLSTDEKLRRLQKALDLAGNTHDISDVVQMHDDGKIHWAHNGDGSIIAEIHDFPRRRAVHLWLVSGELRDVLALEPSVIAWGRENGCTLATATGRRGWGRAAAPLGWRPAWHHFHKAITHE